MSASDLLRLVPDFDSKSATERILAVAWYIHERNNLETFDAITLREAFRAIHAEPPQVSVYLPRMADKRPPLLVRQHGEFRLSGPVRRRLSEELGASTTSHAVGALLKALPEKLPQLTERVFLQETLSCYQAGAFRAATVMAWNLAYDHLTRWVITDSTRLIEFNYTLSSRFPKKTITIREFSDFADLKESEVIETLKSAKMISKNVADLLREKLNRRNAAAHPSALVISQHQADDTITDLVSNIVLAFD